MFRITALNGGETEESGEIHIAKEAQEAIVESEYLRAISLKTEGKPEIAKELLCNLLQTHILNEGAVENIEKMSAIRYNCHKHLAIIAEENDDFKGALHNYLLAMQIDNKDVHTLYQFAQLALKHKNFELAQYVFETCLFQNKNHWLASDGLLNVYIKDNNILAIYEMAVKSIKSNSQSPQILKVLKEILVKFKWILPLGEFLYGTIPSHLLTETTTEPNDDCNIFNINPEETQKVKNIKKEPNDLPKLRTNNLNFFSIGTHILSTLNYLSENNISMLSVTLFHDGFLKHTKQSSPTLTENENLNVAKNEIMEISEPQGNEAITVEPKTSIQTQAVNDNIDINVESSNSKSESGDIGKSKSRRRCSDLHHLEQWGWHKTRKAYRKKIQSDRTDVDHTLLGFLRKAFVKYTESTFEISWPYGNLNEENSFDGIETNCKSCKKSLMLSDFESEVRDIFEKFLNNIKTTKYDLLLLIYWWLKNVSQFCYNPLPDEIKDIYIKLFSIYKNCYDFSNWNQLGKSKFLTNFQICLFYLELQYSKCIKDKRELPIVWLSTFTHLSLICGCTLIEKMNNFGFLFIRLINLEILRDDFLNQNEKCIRNLVLLKQILQEKPYKFTIHLPNLEADCITLEKAISKLKEQERLIDLKKIPDLCAKQQWKELSIFIKKYLHNTENYYQNENWQNDFINLNELLLQSLWSDLDYEECLIYAEKYLHYSTYYYLQENKINLSKSITYALSYIEAITLNEGSEILSVLNEYLSRLIQNIIHILSCQLDPDPEKKSYFANELEMRRSWIILHQVLMRDENIKNNDEISSSPSELETPLPMSFMLLFIAHDYLGNRQACSSDGGQLLLYIFQTVIPNLRAPIYDSCRNHAYEYIEQVTYCLFGFPPKKARSRHLDDHNSTLIELTWQVAIDIFDIYTPETLPEFNSYKVESITVDMEQFLLKTLSLMPNQFDPTAATEEVTRAIAGSSIDSLKDHEDCELPFKIKNIYYLLGDFYFKTRDFNKAIKFYIYDLAFHMQRFDSWAGISLSKASNIETKLNGLIPIDVPQFLNECEEAIRCFDKCISLVHNHILVWIEYGSFAYTIGSFCSRKLKAIQEGADANWLPLLTEKKERMLTISYNCFSLAATLQNSDYVNNESFEEKWLCQYMLGKISEKRKENPNIYLNYYLTASNYLYECSATYPIKINHNNPTTLSVEALEVFYRTNAAILKYVESGLEVARENIVLFKNVLRKLSKSPFAFNKAKIDGSCIYALKRKSCDNPKGSPVSRKSCKETLSEVEQIATDEVSASSTTSPSDNQENSKTPPEIIKCEELRRSSQESTGTSNTTSTSSLSNFSDSDSSSMDNNPEKLSRTQANLNGIYEEALKNLEECVIRFPEHYKSIYRLVHFYLNGPKKMQDLSQCEKLLLHQYRTRVGNIIGGLFYDRKTNNLFNGVWRIPSSEIDRPGSFSAHLVKCVKILIEMLKKQSNYKLCIDIILQLYKAPDNDKRYIMDAERIYLYETAIRYCEGIMTDILNKNKNTRNDAEILDLLLDIYKIQKKCYKYVAQKDSWFSKIFVDVYTFYVENKVQNYPKDLNYTDLAVKLCLQEINYRKNLEKFNSSNMVQNTYETSSSLMTEETRVSYLPGLQYRNRMQTITENITAEATTTFTHPNLIVNDHSSISFPPVNPSSIDPTLRTESYSRFIEFCHHLVEQRQQQTAEGLAVMSSATITENSEKQPPDNINFRFNVNDK